MKRKIYKWYVNSVLGLLAFLNKIGMITFYQPLPQVGIEATKSTGNTRRVLKRWESIKNALPEERMSVLDIGCNVGFYSFNLAQMGHFVTALEPKRSYVILMSYVKEELGLRNMALSTMFLKPDNIQTIPKHDCVLLLAVFHHWCKEYGKERALSMLDEVYNKTERVLFFETGEPSSIRYKEALPDMGESVEQWLHDYFKAKGCASIKTISDRESSRYLLAVYKNQESKNEELINITHHQN